MREPERLVLLDWRGSFVGHGWGSDNLMSYPFYRDLRGGTDVFDGVFGRAATAVNLAFENSAEPLGAEIVTGSYFSVLGVRPWMGRLITESDDVRRGEHPVVVVSFDYWRTHLGGRADIVGRTVLINTHPMTIVGVAEAGFHGIDWGEVPAIWIPTMMKREATPDFGWLEDRRGRWLHVFGRLRPGMSREQAQTALQPWFKATLDSDTRREDWPPDGLADDRGRGCAGGAGRARRECAPRSTRDGDRSHSRASVRMSRGAPDTSDGIAWRLQVKDVA